jgi:hypothetical protein
MEGNLAVEIRSLDDQSVTARVARTMMARSDSRGAWAMLTRIDFPYPGCWEISGQYLGQTLSFVVETVPATSDPLPFKGSFYTTSAFEYPPPQGCELYHESTQAGDATHLGFFTGTAAVCGFNSAIVEDPPFDFAGGAPPFFVAEGTAHGVWTAANGDTLAWNLVDHVFVTSLSDGSSSAIGTVVVTGGTGRFEGATGELQAIGNSAAGRTTVSGWLLYDASIASQERQGRLQPPAH